MKTKNKINPDNQKPEIWAFDSPLFVVLNTALRIMLILSASSVSLGLVFQFKPQGQNFFINIVFYAAIIAFTLAWAIWIDGTSSKGAEWLTNAIQKKDFWEGKEEKIRSAVLFAAILSFVIFLTVLSLKLSKISAEKAGNVFSGEAKTTDTNRMTNDNEAGKAAAIARFDSSYNQTSRQYENDIKALEAPYLAKIEQYQGYVENAKLQKSGIELQSYVNKQTGNIARQKTKMNEATAKLRQEKTEALAVIRSDQKAERERLNQINDTNLSGTIGDNQKKSEEHEKFKQVFSKLFGYIAGYSIIVALLISITIALLKARAGIEPVPYEPKYNLGAVWEVLTTPFFILERRMLNKVRTKKASLPSLIQPEAIPIYDNFKGVFEDVNGKPEAKKEEINEEQIERRVREALEKCYAAGDRFHIEAQQLISMYLQTDNESLINSFLNECLLFQKGESEINPFHPKRAPLGFFSDEARNAMRNASSGAGYDFSENSTENAGNALRNAAEPEKEYKSEIAKAYFSQKICEAQGCGKSFTPTVKHHKFCSNACRQVANGLKNRV